MQNVTFLLLPHIMASSISLPLEMLNAADNIRRAARRSAPRLHIRLAAEQLQPVQTSGGISIVPDTRLCDVNSCDLLVIPGLWRNPFATVQHNPAISHWLASQVTQHRNICAVGTGSSFLAEAGLLHKKPATTHWFYFDAMEKHYPQVQWKRQHLITQAGNVYCAGSINSVADLTIHFIEQGFSSAIARRVESQFSPEIRRAYDMHLFDNSDAGLHNDELIAGSQHYIRQHFADTIDFAALAGGQQISLRTFQRRFHKATGFTPLKYQQHIRISQARQLLQNSNLSIQEISEMVGYVDAAHFAALFRRMTEQTPHAWREAVRGKLFRA